MNKNILFPACPPFLTFVFMMRLLIFPLFFFFACNSAQQKVVEKPANLISEDSMVQILTDVHLLEAALNIRNPQPMHMTHVPPEFAKDSASYPAVSADPEVKKPLPYYDIFKKHGITEKEYEASMNWYSSDPQKISAIEDEVIVELTKRQLKERAKK